jgi:hypothetical protein
MEHHGRPAVNPASYSAGPSFKPCLWDRYPKVLCVFSLSLRIHAFDITSPATIIRRHRLWGIVNVVKGVNERPLSVSITGRLVFILLEANYTIWWLSLRVVLSPRSVYDVNVECSVSFRHTDLRQRKLAGTPFWNGLDICDNHYMSNIATLPTTWTILDVLCSQCIKGHKMARLFLLSLRLHVSSSKLDEFLMTVLGIHIKTAWRAEFCSVQLNYKSYFRPLSGWNWI